MVFIPLLAGAGLLARAVLPKVAARAAPFALKFGRALPGAALAFAKTTKGKIALGLGGAALSSGTVRTQIIKAVRSEPTTPLLLTPLAPLVAGKQAGKVLEAFRQPDKEKRKAALKKAGIIGGLAGAAIGAKPLIQKFREEKGQKVMLPQSLTPSQPVPPSYLPVTGEIPTAEPEVINGKEFKEIPPIRIMNKPITNVIVQNLVRRY